MSGLGFQTPLLSKIGIGFLVVGLICLLIVLISIILYSNTNNALLISGSILFAIGIGLYIYGLQGSKRIVYHEII